MPQYATLLFACTGLLSIEASVYTGNDCFAYSRFKQWINIYVLIL